MKISNELLAAYAEGNVSTEKSHSLQEVFTSPQDVFTPRSFQPKNVAK